MVKRIIDTIRSDATGNGEKQFTKSVGFPVAGSRKESGYYLAGFAQSPYQIGLYQTALLKFPYDKVVLALSMPSANISKCSG